VASHSWLCLLLGFSPLFVGPAFLRPGPASPFECREAKAFRFFFQATTAGANLDRSPAERFTAKSGLPPKPQRSLMFATASLLFRFRPKSPNSAPTHAPISSLMLRFFSSAQPTATRFRLRPGSFFQIAPKCSPQNFHTGNSATARADSARPEPRSISSATSPTPQSRPSAPAVWRNHHQYQLRWKRRHNRRSLLVQPLVAIPTAAFSPAVLQPAARNFPRTFNQRQYISFLCRPKRPSHDATRARETRLQILDFQPRLHFPSELKYVIRANRAW